MLPATDNFEEGEVLPRPQKFPAVTMSVRNLVGLYISIMLADCAELGASASVVVAAAPEVIESLA